MDGMAKAYTRLRMQEGRHRTMNMHIQYLKLLCTRSQPSTTLERKVELLGH